MMLKTTISIITGMSILTAGMLSAYAGHDRREGESIHYFAFRATLGAKLQSGTSVPGRMSVSEHMYAIVNDMLRSLQRGNNNGNQKKQTKIHELAYDKQAADKMVKHFFTFKKYMEAALYNKHWGFYSSGVVQFNAFRDFTTYPQALSPYFGQALAVRAYRLWLRMLQNGTIAKGEPFSIVEFGAGNGVLAHDVLTYASAMSVRRQGEWHAFYTVLRYTIGERADDLQVRQKDTCREFGDKLTVKKVDARDLFASRGFKRQSLKGMIVSNELLDVFGVYKVRFEKDGTVTTALPIPCIPRHLLRKICVALNFKEGFCRRLERESARYIREYKLPPTHAIYLSAHDYLLLREYLASTADYRQRILFMHAVSFNEAYVAAESIPELAAYIKKYKMYFDRECARVKKPIAVYLTTGETEYMKQIADLLRSGQTVTIDYGGMTDYLFNTQGNRLRIYGVMKSVADPYASPGKFDITADINFEVLMQAGKENGLETSLYEQQAALMDGIINLEAQATKEALEVRAIERYINENIDENVTTIEKVHAEIKTICAGCSRAERIDRLAEYIADKKYILKPYSVRTMLDKVGYGYKTYMLGKIYSEVNTWCDRYRKQQGFRLLIQEKGLREEMPAELFRSEIQYETNIAMSA